MASSKSGSVAPAKGDDSARVPASLAMESSFSRILQSQIFTFSMKTTDGPKELYAHSDLIAKISPVLKAMMESHMSEGVSKRAEIAADFDSFDRLCQFAYWRQYSDPEPRVRNVAIESSSPSSSPSTPFSLPSLPLSPPPQIPFRPPQPGSYYGTIDTLGSQGFKFTCQGTDNVTSHPFMASDSKSDYKSSDSLNLRRTSLLSKFDKLSYKTETLSTAETSARVFRPEKLDYTPVLIGHAKLYSVAKVYMCEKLCSLALFKLHRVLSGFQYSALLAVEAIVELIKHVYDDDDLDDPKGETDQLRYLVALFAATQTVEIGSAPEFVDLLEGGGPFVREYWKLVSGNILGSKRLGAK